jgi:divalent metal cation (Fe/Co/Zn/Cd) transporter
MKQGASVGWGALKELVDQVTDPSLQENIHDFVLSQCSPFPSQLATDSDSPSSSSSSTTVSASHSCSTEEFRESLHTSHDHDHDHVGHARASVGDREKPRSSSSKADESDPNTPLPILDLQNIRTFKAGGFILVDLALEAPENMTVEEMTKIERELSRRVRAKFEQVGEVVCRFRSTTPKGPSVE